MLKKKTKQKKQKERRQTTQHDQPEPGVGCLIKDNYSFTFPREDVPLHMERVHSYGYRLTFYLQLIIMEMKKPKEQEAGFIPLHNNWMCG